MMLKNELDELFFDAVALRRKIHEYPEIGFDLDCTVKLVTEELDKMEIPYTLQYGKGSVVAELGTGDERIAFRADMDALPIEEKTDVPFCSKRPGTMHACGHDSHTSILLAVAKHLKAHEKELPRRIRLIFQPSEEGAISGAKMMTENGVMDGVSQIIGIHCENDLVAGRLGAHAGDYQAACIPATIRFHGKSTHAAIPEAGVDAIAMGVEAYVRMKEAVREEAGEDRYIWSVGHFSGGEVHNVVADLCEMDISFRFYNMDFAKRVEVRVRDICNEVADRFGGCVEIRWEMSTGAVYNEPSICQSFAGIAMQAGLSWEEIPQRMSSEDFGWYLEKAPGLIFRFGTRNEALGCTSTAHKSDFKIDEAGMKPAIEALVAYALAEK